MDYKVSARNILDAVGGKQNVISVIHCATRLRFQLVNEYKINQAKLESVDVVKGVVKRSGQLQLIIGEGLVDKVYDDLVPMVGIAKKEITRSKETAKQKNKSIGDGLDTISSIFAPVIPAIVGAGLIWGISYCLTVYHWIDPTNPAYIILNSMGNSAFYFLPITIGFSSAKRFGCNPYVAAVIGGAMIHPSITAFAGTTVSFFGIPMMIQGYASTIIPIILTIWLVSYIEKFLKKHVQDMFSLIITPTLCLIFGTIIGLSICGPIGYWIGSFVASGVVWLYETLGPLGGATQGFLHSIEVITGMQVAMSPITMQNLATYGYDLIYPLAAAANTAQAAACIYIFMKSKNKSNKSIAVSSALSTLIGVTEPAIFGVTLKYRKLFIASCLGAACGGAVMSTFRVVYYGFGLVPFGTIVLAFGDTFVYYMIGIRVAFIATLLFCHFVGDKEIKDKENKMRIDQNKLESISTLEVESILAPITGKVITLKEVNDETFASESIGKGIAIYSESNVVVSPVNGIVRMVFSTKHAIAIESENGTEVLIHIGIDTVKNEGKGFSTFVSVGEVVKTGDKLVEFDKDALSLKWDMVIPVIITNNSIFSSINMTKEGYVRAGEYLMEVIG